jgi:hypothetical protein
MECDVFGGRMVGSEEVGLEVICGDVGEMCVVECSHVSLQKLSVSLLQTLRLAKTYLADLRNLERRARHFGASDVMVVAVRWMQGRELMLDSRSHLCREVTCSLSDLSDQ